MASAGMGQQFRSAAMAVSVALGVTAVPALAGNTDRMGYQAIAAGNLAAAERTITAERRIFPHQPELALNLATVYGRTGRADAARNLYREVLALEPVDLVLADGASYSSHAIARAGLARLSAETIASR